MDEEYSKLAMAILAQARSDLMSFRGGSQKKIAEDAKHFLKSSWAQHISIGGFDADEAIKSIREDKLELAISKADEVIKASRRKHRKRPQL